MKTFRITSIVDIEIEAKNKEDAKDKFYDNIESNNEAVTTFFDRSLMIELIQ